MVFRARHSKFAAKNGSIDRLPGDPCTNPVNRPGWRNAMKDFFRKSAEIVHDAGGRSQPGSLGGNR